VNRGDVFSLSLRGNAGMPRPSIIVHANELLRPGLSILVCPPTSNILDDAVTRPTIEPSKTNGLRMSSQVMVNRMTSAEAGQLGLIIGTLGDEDVSKIDLAPMILLGLAHRLTGPT